MKNFTYLNKSILLIIVFTASFFTAKAQLGSHIGYKAIDSVNYEVILTVYRDCRSLPAPNSVTIEVFGKSTGAFKASLTKFSTKDITGLSEQCPQKSPCNSGTFQYGVEAIVYKNTVNISGGTCIFQFAYSNCCRSSAISTGPASTNHYNTASVNKCYGLNTSTQASLPRIIIGVGQDYRGRIFIGDTVDTQDSIVYTLAQPLASMSSLASFGGAFDYDKPLTFLGFPGKSAGLPAGFHFDKATSDLAFRPITANQVSVICFDAIEYRRVNGIMERVGTSRLEYTTYAINMPNNKVPSISGNSTIACVGEIASITLEAKDTDVSDSTFFDIEGLPKGATVNYSRNGTNALATVSWTPKQSDIRNTPYTFTATTTDNACPFSGYSSKGFSFTVREALTTSDVKVIAKTAKCSSAEIILDINSKIKAPIVSMVDEDGISFGEGDTARLYFKGSGWKKFTVKVLSQNFCDYVLTDSVFITPQYSIQLNTKQDSTVCPNESVHFFSNPQSGTAPFTYWWRDRLNTNNLIDSASFTLKTDTIDIYKNLLVADSNHCIGIDSIKISVSPETKIKVAQDEIEICPNTPFQLTASYVSGPQITKYEWLGVDTLATVSTQTASPAMFNVVATNANGCKVQATTNVKIFSIGVNAGTYNPICKNKTLQLTANSTAGQQPLKYEWLNNNTTNTSLTVTPSKDSLFIIKLEDARGCIVYDTAKITVFPDVKYQLPTATTTCAGVSLKLDLTNITGNAPFTFNWDGTLTTDSSETFTLQQNKTIAIDIFDKNNCKTSGNIAVTVNQNPDSRLGANKTVCQGTSEKLNAFVIGGKKPLNYLWSTGSQDDSITVLVNTPQEVILLVTDDNGCIDRDTVNIDTLPSQKPVLTPLANPFCDNAPPVSLQSVPNTGVWTGAGVNGKIFNPNTAGAGVHPLTFSFTSIYNCPEKGEIVAIVKQTPQPDFTVDKTKGRPNTVFSFTNLTTADTTYTSEWNMGDGSSLITTPSVNHTYTNIGTYTVTLKVNNGVCAAQTEQKIAYIEVDSTFVSVLELEKENIKVYPNPASEILTIKAENEIKNIIIYDVLGKKVLAKKVNALATDINVDRLDNGIYTLSIALENGVTKTTKLVVK